MLIKMRVDMEFIMIWKYFEVFLGMSAKQKKIRTPKTYTNHFLNFSHRKRILLYEKLINVFKKYTF